MIQRAFSLVVLIGTTAVAQTTYPVQIHVTDETGAALASVSISASAHGESGAPLAKTNGQGDAVLQLVSGPYTIRATHPGFDSTWERVSIAGPFTLNLTLRAGSVGNAPLIRYVPPNIPTEALPRDVLIPLIPPPPCRCMRAQPGSRHRADGRSPDFQAVEH